MLRKKQTPKHTGFSAGLEGGTTLIAHNTRVCGDFFFEEQLYINGVIEGDVTAGQSAESAPESAKLVVCAHGRVIGNIRAPNVMIDGVVEGDVYASGKLELAAKARVLGNVHYNLVEMQLGSVVNGQMVSLAETQDVLSATEGATEGATEEADQGSQEAFEEDIEMSPEEAERQKMREAAGDVLARIP